MDLFWQDRSTQYILSKWGRLSNSPKATLVFKNEDHHGLEIVLVNVTS